MNDEQSYNGWANYETWNVALWIGNDEGLQQTAIECKNYAGFVDQMRQYGEALGEVINGISLETPDKVAWNDSGLDTEALDEMLKEIGD